MTYYFIYSAEGPDVQSGLEERLKIEWDKSREELNEYLNSIGYELCVSHFESYKDIDEYEEETGSEWEALYYFEQITKEEYEDCGLWDLEI